MEKKDENTLDIVFRDIKKFYIHTHTRFFHLYLLSKEGLKCNESLFSNQHLVHILPISCLPCYSVDLYQNHTGMKNIWNPDLIAYEKREEARRGKVKVFRHTQKCSSVLISVDYFFHYLQILNYTLTKQSTSYIFCNKCSSVWCWWSLLGNLRNEDSLLPECEK